MKIFFKKSETSLTTVSYLLNYDLPIKWDGILIRENQRALYTRKKKDWY